MRVLCRVSASVSKTPRAALLAMQLLSPSLAMPYLRSVFTARASILPAHMVLESQAVFYGIVCFLVFRTATGAMRDFLLGGLVERKGSGLGVRRGFLRKHIIGSLRLRHRWHCSLMHSRHCSLRLRQAPGRQDGSLRLGSLRRGRCFRCCCRC